MSAEAMAAFALVVVVALAAATVRNILGVGR